jgi:hypothetical protein
LPAGYITLPKENRKSETSESACPKLLVYLFSETSRNNLDWLLGATPRRAAVGAAKESSGSAPLILKQVRCRSGLRPITESLDVLYF